MKTKKHRETTSKKIIHRPGNIYVKDGERYMLAISGYADKKVGVLCTLMSLHYGNRWVEPIKIADPFNGLNAAQWRVIQGTEVGKFTYEDDHINWVD